MGLQEDIKYIRAKIDKEEEERKQKKEKKFRLPFGSKVGKNKSRQGYVTVMKINENGNVNFKRELIKEQTIIVDGIPRLATPEYVMRWKKNPIVIQPAWSVEPFNPAKSFEQSFKDGSNTTAYPILLARMKSETVNATKKKIGMTGITIFGLIIAAIIGYALLTGGG